MKELTCHMITPSIPCDVNFAVRSWTGLRTPLYLNPTRFLLCQLLTRILSIIIFVASLSFVPRDIVNYAGFRETGCAEEDRTIDAVFVDLA